MIEHNGLMDELDAAEKYGWSDYWSASRSERALMVGKVRVDNAIRAMIEFESQKK